MGVPGVRSRAKPEPVGGDQTRQPWIDAGEMSLGVAGGAAQDGAEGADGGEGLTGLLGLIEVARVVRDDERVVQGGGWGARAFGQAPQLEQERVEAREIGLRPPRAAGERLVFDIRAGPPAR